MFESIKRNSASEEKILSKKEPLSDPLKYQSLPKFIDNSRKAIFALFVAFGIQSVETHSYAQALSEEQTQEESLARMNAKMDRLVEETGISFEELSAFCNLTVNVEAKEGAPYIFHIAQMHKTEHTSHLLYTDPMREEVTTSQINVARILEYLVEKDIVDVFDEGISKEFIALLDRDKGVVNDLREFLNETEDNDEGYIKFNNVYQHLYPHLEERGEKTIYANAPLHHIVHIIREKMNAFEAGSISSSNKLKLESQRKELDALFPRLGQPDTPYHEGAAITSYIQGNIRLHENSTLEIGDETDKFLAWQTEIIAKAENNTLTQEEVDRFKSEYQKRIFDDRERSAVNVIAEWSATNKRQIIPLIFGAHHDFTKAIEEYNKASGEDGLGLIMCQQKDQSAGSQ